jgi:cytochrome c-type biogenesis protein
MTSNELGLGLAFLAGLASFFSPCVFTLVPAYIGYLSGRSLNNAQENRWDTFAHALAFVFGFSLVFILLGLGASAIGMLLNDLSPILTKVGGIVVIIFGLHMTGIIRIPFLQYDIRHQKPPDRKLGLLSSVLLGVFFSAGWSPCIGPILGVILTLSINSGSLSQGGLLLVAYSVGLAIPFLIAALEINLIINVIRRYSKAMHYVEISMGILMIIVGLMLFFGQFGQIAQLGSFFGTINEVRVGWIMLVYLLVSVVLAFLPAFIAKRKGRDFLEWYIFGVALIFIAIPTALLIKPLPIPTNGQTSLTPDETQAIPDN